MGFPGGSVVKNLLANVGDTDSIPESGRFPWRRKWQPTLVFLPGKSYGQRSLKATVLHVTKSWTQLSECACTLLYKDLHGKESKKGGCMYIYN